MYNINWNNLLLTYLCLGISLFTILTAGAATDDNKFYLAPTFYSTVAHFKSIHPVADASVHNDSQALQTAIDNIAKQGGGKLIIHAGTYAIKEIWLKSNVHIEVDSKAIFLPFIAKGQSKKKSKKSYVLFNFSSPTATPLKNVSIKGVNGHFTIDNSKVPEQNNRMFNVRNVQNFLIENVNVLDQHSKFSTFVLNGTTVGNKVYSPNGGIIRNTNVYNSDYGYGLVQMQLGENILFENLYGEGGTALRLETHTKSLHDPSKFRPINNVTARNIRCEDGNSALQVSPHYVKNGKFTADSISSVNCGWTVRIGRGFVNPKEKKLGLTPGYFSKKSTISNVSAIYNSNKAQLKTKHYRYMPCNLRSLIETEATSLFPHGDSYTGPTIGVLLNSDGYLPLVNKESITSTHGFQPKQLYVTKEDQILSCKTGENSKSK